MSKTENKLLEIFAGFEIYEGRDGYVLIPDDGQVSFDFFDPYELPDEVHDRLREISEQRDKVRKKAKARLRQIIDARFIKQRASSPKPAPIKTAYIKTVPIFSMVTLVEELKHTGGVRFRGEVDGFDWDALAFDLHHKSSSIQPADSAGLDPDEYDDYALPSQAGGNTPETSEAPEYRKISRGGANLLRALTDYSDGSPYEPDSKLERPRLVINTDSLSSDETVRANYLKQIFDDKRGHRRPVLVADEAMIARLETLSLQAPQFSVFVDLYARAARLSQTTQTGFRVPPTVLLGPPGIGKTWVVGKLADALREKCTKLAMNTNSDSGMLLGHPQSWRGAKQGQLSKALIACQTANPILFLDEIDKLQATGTYEDPYMPLLTLLEVENAKVAMDEYLCIPFDLSHAIIISTANDVSALSAPLLDRLLVIEIDAPDQIQRLNVVRNILKEVIHRFGNQLTIPNEDVIQKLTSTQPRKMIRLIELALGFMAQERRSKLTIEDLRDADKLMQHGHKASNFGFMSGRSVSS